MRNTHWFRRRLPVLPAVLLAAAALSTSGCNILGWGAQALSGDGNKTLKMEAEYRGLPGKTVGVIVAADEYTMFEHPGSPAAVSRAVSRQIAADIPGVKILDPKQIAKFQSDNPYWGTLPNGRLLRDLKIDRLVYVDLTQFSTHEPGDRNVWKGTIVAHVSVAEAEAANPDNFVYQTLVSVEFPPDKPVGVVDSDDATMQLGMLKLFGAEVSNRFHKHEKVVKQW